MSDNSYGTTFGPSTPGALNLVSGSTGGVDPAKEIRGPSKDQPNADGVTGGAGTDPGTGDPHPYYDDGSTPDPVALSRPHCRDRRDPPGRPRPPSRAPPAPRHP